jgi:hypothetical protein
MKRPVAVESASALNDGEEAMKRVSGTVFLPPCKGAPALTPTGAWIVPRARRSS